MVTWYGDSEDDVDDHQDPLDQWEVGGEEERGEEGGHPHSEVVEGPEVLVLLQSESVEVGDGSQEGAGGAPRQEESLLLVMKVEGLESFLQVQTGRGQYDHAGDIAVNITSTSSLVG